MFQPTLTKPWTTHIGVLVKVLLMSSGDVVELGAGPFSTPLLHWVCRDMNRKLISYESDPEYYQFARRFRSRLHRTVLVKDWNEIDTKTHRGVIFIDNNPSSRRSLDAVRFKDSADYIVIHDTNAVEDYSNVWQNFKYMYTWKYSRPWVSVVSNFKNLSGL
jgi:hypothetical protein